MKLSISVMLAMKRIIVISMKAERNANENTSMAAGHQLKLI